MKVVVVIPAHNESATVAAAVRGAKVHGIVVLVDDGSSDDTAAQGAAAGADVVRHARNRGYEGALQSGFERAAQLDADVVVTLDADGQHPAALIGLFTGPLASGAADLVIGVRSRSARFAEVAFGTYTRVRFGVPDILCGLKSYRMALYQQHGRFDTDRSVGTELAIASLRRGARAMLVSVPIAARRDAPRFGSVIRANLRIARALVAAMRSDTAAWWSGGQSKTVRPTWAE